MISFLQVSGKVFFLHFYISFACHMTRQSHHPRFDYPNDIWCRSPWPGGQRRGSAVARLLGLWVRIPSGAWRPVSYFCVLSSRGLGFGLITRTEESTECACVSECDREASIKRRPWPTGGCCTIGGG